MLSSWIGVEMPALKGELGIAVYAPVRRGDSNRPLAVIHGMERALPGLYLGWIISDEGQRIPLPQRDAWIAQQKLDEDWPLFHTGEGRERVSLTALERPAALSPGNRAQLEVHAALTPSAASIAAAMDVLEAIAEEAYGYWGHMTPFDAGVEISEQVVHPKRKPGIPPRGLPALKLRDDLPSPEIPCRLGWLNHWSAAAARAIGFPDASRDAELLFRARRTATGGWIVRLTEAPLNLDDPAHLEELKRVYERFPVIGGRSNS
jgi:hypothetical protein